MDTAVLEASDVSAGYGGVPAIIDVSLELHAGEIVALMGANGAGKSTTLMSLAGHLALTKGSLRLFGEDPPRTPAKRAAAGLAFLPEGRGVFMGLTTRENLVLGQGSVEGALEYFPELETRMNVRAGLLSGGEQRMLSLARVLAAKPRVILADEVSLGLAPLIVQHLFAALAAAARSGAAVMLVEQHPRIALQWAERALVMQRGRVVMAGTAKEMKEKESEMSALYL